MRMCITLTIFSCIIELPFIGSDYWNIIIIKVNTLYDMVHSNMYFIVWQSSGCGRNG